jgi:FKBP-type peptidyl-prolyl cis-trans isomerase FkpA
MNRTLLIFALFIVCCIASCTKSSLFGEVQYKAQAKIDDSIVHKYIESQGLQGKFKHVQNNDTIGVYYMVIDTGLATTLFTTSTQVTVGDTGRLLTNGQVFYETNSFHPSYSLGSVIRGWQLGIPEARTGGEVRLLIPSRYAYGHYPPAQIGIPPDAVLDFSIRLYNVIN